MISIDKLVQIGFTVSQATDISNFFRNIGYIAKLQTSDFVDGYTVPSNNIIRIQTIEGLKIILKAETQAYKDIEGILIQKNNMKPNQSAVNEVIVYKTDGLDYGASIDEFVKANANWAQLTIDSRLADDIKKVGDKAIANDRLFVAQTDDEDIADKTLNNIAEYFKNNNNSNISLFYHSSNTEPLACAMASICAQPKLGAVGQLYSQVTNVMPKEYTETIMSNLEDQSVSYYSEVNPINGGGVSQYATPIVMGAYQLNGEDSKRRYIRYAIDKLLKAKSIDFLVGKYGYQDTSSGLLNALLTMVLIELQRNDLIKKDTETKKGFELFDIKPSELQDTEPTLYNSETYKIVGYYRDSKTGRKVIIDLVIDPNMAEMQFYGF